MTGIDEYFVVSHWTVNWTLASDTSSQSVISMQTMYADRYNIQSGQASISRYFGHLYPSLQP